MPATPQNFSPAMKFGPVLGIKHNFAEAFPNLDKLPDNYQEQRLDSLSTSLQAEAQQSKEQIEVFGAKISSDLIPLFALPALAVFLFQFSAVAFYIRSNVERLEVDEASQWVLLLRGWAFLVLSFGTMFGLPAAAAVLTYLIVPGEAFLPKSINLVLVLLAIFCAFVAFVGIQCLRSQVAPNPGQATQAASKLEGT